MYDEWRTDLMGTCRPDFAANIVDKDVSVTTPYGRIRGFYVYLFDGPGVAIGDRPGPNHFRKLWRTVSTFLGIPYATPPVNEGRFKVIDCLLIEPYPNLYQESFLWTVIKCGRTNSVVCFGFISHREPRGRGAFGMPQISVRRVHNRSSTSAPPKASAT